MTYKWLHFILAAPLLASTYGSGSYNSSTYNGAGVAAATPTPILASPTPAPIVIGPVTLPVTGASLAVAGALMIALAAGLAYWVYQRRIHRKEPLHSEKDGIL